jgi:hypothetical protein
VDSREKMRFSLKDVGADIRSHDQTYDPSCHSGQTDSSPDVRSMCDRKTLFSPTVPYLLFPCSRVVLVEIELMISLFSIFEVVEPQWNYMEF